MITVVNIRNAPPNAVYIGRKMPKHAGSPLGNPFKPADPNNEDDRQLCLRNYKTWLWRQMCFETRAAAELQRLATLAQTQDIALACWCAPKSCHGEIVKAAIEFLNR
jgi:hypothetical protein